MDQKRQPGIQLGQIFLSYAHLQHRADALTHPPNTPIHDLPFEIQVRVFGPSEETVAGVSVRASTPKDANALYQIAVEMTALVQSIQGEENLAPREYAMRMGPAALYPFVREAVANLTMRGRFGAVWLRPVNFTAGVVADRERGTIKASAVFEEPPTPAPRTRVARKK